MIFLRLMIILFLMKNKMNTVMLNLQGFHGQRKRKRELRKHVNKDLLISFARIKKEQKLPKFCVGKL